jgi:hypothetical protein
MRTKKPPPALLSAAFVYIRKGSTVPPLSPLYSGPYRVLASGPKVFRLQVGEREETVSIDRLKPHRGSRPRPASAAAFKRPAASWLIFSSHPLPQGLVLARGPVAERKRS